MRYFLDTEFIDDGKTIDLISIGIVAEDGRTYYAEIIDCDLTRASQWVKDNVIVHLECGASRRTRAQVRDEIEAFCFSPEGKAEFWGYFCAYDWVAVCQLFGTMMQLPMLWPMYCHDVKQLSDFLGVTPPPPETEEHHALIDAQWTMRAWQFLNSRKAA